MRVLMLQPHPWRTMLFKHKHKHQYQHQYQRMLMRVLMLQPHPERVIVPCVHVSFATHSLHSPFVRRRTKGAAQAEELALAEAGPASSPGLMAPFARNATSHSFATASPSPAPTRNLKSRPPSRARR
jgi:hypothetical protein